MDVSVCFVKRWLHVLCPTGKTKNTFMKERIWINRVVREFMFLFFIPTSTTTHIGLNQECLLVHRGKGLFFFSVFVGHSNLAGKKQSFDPMWKVLNKEVDLGEPTSFMDHVYLGCTQRQCEISKDTVDNYRTMFESRISAGE